MNNKIRLGQYVIVELHKNERHVSGTVCSIGTEIISLDTDGGERETFFAWEVNCVMSDTAEVIWQ